MLSSTLCVYTVLAIICCLIMNVDSTTCDVVGYENRTTFITIRNDINNTCGSNGSCIQVRRQDLRLGGSNGTIAYQTQNGLQTNVTLKLSNTTTTNNYWKILILKCGNGTRGKLRFGKSTGISRSTVLETLENNTVTQPCVCLTCNCGNLDVDFFCNCKFNNASYENAVSRHSTPITVSTHFTSTTSSVPQTTMVTTTVRNARPYITSQHDTAPSRSTPRHVTSPKTDYVSAPQQSDGNGKHTMAIVGGLSALVFIIIGVTVFVCLRRRQWNTKPPDYSESCIANPSYGETQDDQKCAGLDNMGYEESGKEIHTYDMADETKPEASGELDYSYANYGGQSDSQEHTINLNSHKLQSENNDYDLANASSRPNDYFVIEKSDASNLIENSARFMTETGDNDANERAETMRNGTISPGVDNYFLLEESDSATTATGTKLSSGVLGGNYFLVKQQSVSETKNSEHDVYELAHSRSHMNSFGDRKTESKNSTQQYQDDDPYDHARVGHVRTNGLDDGVYDELKKQNVRYRDDDVDNDYDHC